MANCVELCGYCGRAEQTLFPFEGVYRRIVRNGDLQRCLKVENCLGEYEKGVLMEGLCNECIQWLNIPSRERPRKTESRVWGKSWPSYVAKALLGSCSGHVWRCLPTEIRYWFRFLKRKTSVADEKETVAMHF